MNSTLPEPIATAGFTPEQKEYLNGLFAGVAARGQRFGDVEPAPAAEPKPAERIFEERIKHELHPLDAYSRLLENAAANKAPDKEDTFRFKWNGLFFLTPAKEAFMARLRIPGGVVKTFQLRELANVARELTSGYVQITTRANLQMRLIQPKDAPEVLRRIQSVGLHTRGAGADNIRNLTANPTAGIDPHELLDVMPLCQELGQIIINDRAFYDLPRKFNIAYDGGGLIGTVEDTNDIGVKAVRVEETASLPSSGGERPSPAAATLAGPNASFPHETTSASSVAAPGDGRTPPNPHTGLSRIEPGIYFRIALGGATGHKAFARDLGVLVKPAELNKVIVALVRVFIANGNRGNRKKARLKHLLEEWSLEKYLAETEKLLGYQLRRAPADLKFETSNLKSPRRPFAPRRLSAKASRPELHRRGHAGWADHAQADAARGRDRRPLRLKRNPPDGVAELHHSERPDAFVETVKKALRKIGFDTEQSLLRGGLMACTGNSYCKFAAANTKGHALELADYLDKKFQLDLPINIHLTGCPNSCAQHYMGDIGLLGTRVKGAEGYHVFVGGGFGANQAVGRQVFSGLTFNDLKPTLEKC